MEKNEKQDHLLSSVTNALRILRSFSMDEPELRVSDLAVSLGLSKSTVSRLLSTLAHEDFVIKNPETSRYRLGLSVLALSGAATSSLEIHREAQHILFELVKELGETAHICVLEGMDTLYLHKVECKHPVRILTHYGKRNPAYCTSSGKVLLAYQSEDFIERMLENGLKSVTKYTTTNPNEFRENLKAIRDQGFAFSKNELLEGVVSIAAPVRDYSGKVIAAITVVGPVERIQPYKIRPYAKKIISASLEISDRLGFWR